MSVELKPCPFCGVEPVLSQDFFGRYDVRCLNTGCEIMPSTRVYDKAEDAATSWNRRAESQCESAQVSVKSVEAD